ncbi:MAG: hypothetical protein KatS3mg015_1631 [Fimbriimonadales bacterium]|nr:MAG: hypothetical protein KatS3mg015_1631 [Fimbriimonadales bacterium]
MRWRKVSDPDDPILSEAGAALRAGSLVIGPTETVYGLFADATQTEAVLAVFAAKGRRPDHPLSVAVASAEEAKRMGVAWDERAERLASAFWPGPLTLVLPLDADAKLGVSEAVLGGEKTLGVRVPDHPIALALVRAAGCPLVATSANESGKPPPSDCKQAIEQVGPFCAFALDAGPAEMGVASTVITLAQRPFGVIREGGLSPDAVARALQE